MMALSTSEHLLLRTPSDLRVTLCIVSYEAKCILDKRKSSYVHWASSPRFPPQHASTCVQSYTIFPPSKRRSLRSRSFLNHLGNISFDKNPRPYGCRFFFLCSMIYTRESTAGAQQKKNPHSSWSQHAVVNSFFGGA